MKYWAYFLLGLFIGVATIDLLHAKREAKEVTAIQYIQQITSDTLSQWSLLQLAIVKTESEFNTLAVGKSGAVGMYQITGIYVDEVNRILGEQVYSHADAFDFVKSKEMFDIYQGHYNPDKELCKAIYLHNPKGDCIGYSAKVLKNLEEIRKYETIRQIIKNQ